MSDKAQKGENVFQKNLIANLCEDMIVFIYSWFQNEPIAIEKGKTKTLDGNFMEMHIKDSKEDQYSPAEPFTFEQGAAVEVRQDGKPRPKRLLVIQLEDKEKKIERKIIEWLPPKSDDKPMSKEELKKLEEQLRKDGPAPYHGLDWPPPGSS